MTRAFALAFYAGATAAALGAVALTGHALLAGIRVWRAITEPTDDIGD